VHAADGNDAAWAVLRACAEAGVPVASPDGRRAGLRHVVIRVSRATGEQMVTLVVTDAGDRRLRQVTARLVQRMPRLAGLHVNVLQGRSSWLFGPQTRKVHGRPYIREHVAGVSYLIGPTAFFQTNVEAAAILVEQVLAAVPPDTSHALDLYAGVGLFALPLARRGVRVTGIEESAEAVEAARRSQHLNGIGDRQCRFIHARVEEALGRIASSPWHATGPAVVVLDPPRAGCDRAVLTRLMTEVGPDTLVYVSCEPEALARDLALCLTMARQCGLAYDVRRVQPVDMFPHTAHVESVAVLQRRGSPRASRGRIA
jgi:23S rRNA (uracil1939-C5)-methyltransferase